MWAKQSTAATLIVGPILDSTGAEYAAAVIGDLSLSKNGGTLTALAAAATLTHIANGQYTLVLTTGNSDTLGRAQITCNKSTYQMPEVRLMVVPANVFDSMILGSDFLQSDAVQFASQTITASSGVTLPSSIASPTNITAATGIVLSGVTHTGAVIPTVSTLTGHTAQTGDSFARIGANGAGLTAVDDATLAAIAALNNLSSAQVTAAVPTVVAIGNEVQTRTIARVTLVDTCTTNTDMRGTDNAALAATALSTAVWTATIAGRIDVAVSSRLAPTTANRTIAVSAAGAVELDSTTSTKIDAILEDTGTTLPAQIAGISGGGGSGTGARTVTITVNDGAAVLQNATVRMTEGVNTFTALTNVSGVAVFNLDDATYAVAITKGGYTYAGTTIVVNGTETATYSMTAVAVTPGAGTLTTGYLTCLDELGAVEEGVSVRAQLVQIPASGTGLAYDSAIQLELSNASGVVEFPMIKGGRYLVWRGAVRPPNGLSPLLIAADAGSTTALGSLIGP